MYGIILAAVIVAFYASLGGIRSVTLTDVIQLFTFSTVIPTLAFFIFSHLNGNVSVIHTLQTSELFDYHKIFDFSQKESLTYLLLFIFFLIPDFNPAIFQRIAMAKNTMQIRKSFAMAGITYLIIICMIAFIGLLVLTVEPGLDSKNLVKHIILDYSYVGLKGLTLAGVMAMVMSTADSFINSTAVLVVHDLCKPLKIKAIDKLIKNELTATRIASCLITIFAFMLTLTEDNLRNLMIQTLNFYFPVVSMPFILTVFGFRAKTASVLIAMAAGFSTAMLSKILFHGDAVESSLLGVVMNLVFLLASHYLLKTPGEATPREKTKNWTINADLEILPLRKRRWQWIKRFIKKIANFNLLRFLKQNTPKRESIYIAVSIFCMIATYTAVFTIPEEVKKPYLNLIEVIYPSMLFVTTALLSYPLWPAGLKQSNVIVLVWHLVIFYVLVCSCFFFVLISNFSSIQLTVFMFNLMLLSTLLRWELALSMIFLGVILTEEALKAYLGEDILTYQWLGVQYKMGYLLLLTSGILISFLKPKQEAADLVWIKEERLAKEMTQKNDELSRSLSLKREFINNISHEVRTPLMGITTLGKNLYDVYNKLTPKQLDNALKTIADSSERLESLMNNILDLSNLASSKYQLELKPINLSELIYSSMDICSKLYLGEKELEFVTNIADNIFIEGDEHYLRSCVDNLIINAIKYSNAGKITINLQQKGSIPRAITFMIKDQGVGIPEAELQSIFDPFIESSRTHTSAGGRGIGLALCKKTIELHGGKIWAGNNKNNNKRGGAVFYFVLYADTNRLATTQKQILRKENKKHGR